MEQESRIAVMAIIVENRESVDTLNHLLHEYGDYIVGRMGLPYEKKGVNIVSIALDAPNDTISALAGKIGNIPEISVKTAYASKYSSRFASSATKNPSFVFGRI